MRVLIAEDSQIMRKIIKANLAKLSVTKVYEALDGESAFNMLIANPKINLIFTDLNMPLVNGLELCKKIRSQPKFANIKIVVISEFLNEVTKESFLNIGVSGFVPKPFDLKAFNDVVVPIVDSMGDKEASVTVFGKEDLIKKIKEETPMISLTVEELTINFEKVTIKIPTDKLLDIGKIESEEDNTDYMELHDK
ncbi:MAG: response regulator [Campylobacterales bacterium]|nr:response regulator [Campylobacterales bacterium]